MVTLIRLLRIRLLLLLRLLMIPIGLRLRMVRLLSWANTVMHLVKLVAEPRAQQTERCWVVERDAWARVITVDAHTVPLLRARRTICQLIVLLINTIEEGSTAVAKARSMRAASAT